MAISEAANNVIGGIGGFILAACLAPQILRMVSTRSARDLSYFFIVFYIIGLVLTCVYMIYVDAVVGYIAVIIEILLASLMLAYKIYLDHWGPYAAEGRGTPTLAIPARARMELSRFLGGAGAPFPRMMAPEARHAAAHLLLDCRLMGETNDSEGKGKGAVAIDKGVANGKVAEGAVVVSGVGGAALAAAEGGRAPLQGLRLSEFADMLESCLEEAGMDVQRRQTHHFASFRQRGADPLDAAAEPPAAANLCWVPCRDGYASAMYLPESATLAVDLVAAAPEATAGMNIAAEAFCRELTQRHPGAQIMASAVSRLPAY